MRKLIIILLLLVLVFPVQAADFNNSAFGLNLSQNVNSVSTASNNLSTNKSSDFSAKDVGSDMVAEGINKGLTRMGDDIYKQFGQERGFIFRFITWNIKPDQIPTVKEFYTKNLKLAFPLAFLFILGTVISRSIAISNPAAFTNVFGRKDFAQNDLVGGGLFLIIGLTFGFLFLGFMALLDLVNSYLMVTVLDSIAPSFDNGVMYLLMALIELALSVFFIYRQIWIVAAYVFSPLYGLLFASGYLKEFVDSVGDKFLRAMIMQPFCIVTTVVWIIVMKAISVSNTWMQWDASRSGLPYVALFLILLDVCCWCIWGKMTFVKRIVGFGVIKKVF